MQVIYLAPRLAPENKNPYKQSVYRGLCGE